MTQTRNRKLDDHTQKNYRQYETAYDKIKEIEFFLVLGVQNI